MGCCPSKSRAKRDARCSVSAEKKQADVSSATATTGVTATTTAAGGKAGGDDDGSQPLASPSPCSSNSNQNNATSMTFLLDRGDGTLMFRSDGDPTPSSPPPVSTKEVMLSVVAANNRETSNCDAKEGNNVVASRSPELTFDVSMPPSPSRMTPQTSPRKAPVNYEDMPINSMYHRIHTVEAEAQDARRQEELRAEAERREREVREFKASMLAS